MPLQSRAVSRGWTFRPRPDRRPSRLLRNAASLPAEVPGCVHTDLLGAGLVPDPYLDENELSLNWIGHQRWHYRTSIDWTIRRPRPARSWSSRVSTPSRRCCSTAPRSPAPTTSTARFRVSTSGPPAPPRRTTTSRSSSTSVWDYAEAQRDPGTAISPNAYPSPFNFVRKMACNFGWDWGPSLVTAGIWKPVTLQSWSTARLARVRPHVTVEGANGKVRVELVVELDRATWRRRRGHGRRSDLVRSEVDRSRPATRPAFPQRVRAGRPRSRAVVAAHDMACHSRSTDCGIDRCTTPSPEACWTKSEQAHRLPQRRTRHHGRRNGFRLHLRRQRDADLRARRELDPGRLLPDPDHARPTARPHRAGNGRQPESAPHLGRRDVRIGRVLRVVRRAGGARLAGLPVRLRRLPGGRAVAQRGDRRGPGQRHPVDAAPQPGHLERLQRKHLGLPGLGLEGVDRRAHAPGGEGYYLDLLPKIVAEIDPGRFRTTPGAPYSGSTRRFYDPNDPDDHGLRHIWDVWNDSQDYTEYARTTASRASSPSSVTRRPPNYGHPPPQRSAERPLVNRNSPGRCCTTRKPPTAT